MTIEQRMERVERQNQRLKKGMFAIVLAGISLLVMGQAAPPKVHDLIRAKKIEVVSLNEQTRIELKTFEGTGRISTFNSKGKEIVALAAAEDGGGAISAFNSKGKKRVILGATTDGGGAISAYDPNGIPLIGFRSRKNGEGTLVQYNRAGEPQNAWP